MREQGGGAQPPAVRSPWRSKRRVVLLVLGAMLAMFTIGVIYRVARPTEEDRVLRDLPVYPGARRASLPATDPTTWIELGSGFEDPIVFSYLLPRGTSGDDVRRFYGTHLPRSFRREGLSCWARDDARVLLVYEPAETPTLDVGVATDAECPNG